MNPLKAAITVMAVLVASSPAVGGEINIDSISLKNWTWNTPPPTGDPLAESSSFPTPAYGQMFTNSCETAPGTSDSDVNFGAFKMNFPANGQNLFKAWFQTSEDESDLLWHRFEVTINGSFSRSLSEDTDVFMFASSASTSTSPLNGDGVWHSMLNGENFGNDIGVNTRIGEIGYEWTIKIIFDLESPTANPGSNLPELPNALMGIEIGNLGDPVPGPAASLSMFGLWLAGRRRHR